MTYQPKPFSPIAVDKEFYGRLEPSKFSIPGDIYTHSLSRRQSQAADTFTTAMQRYDEAERSNA